MEVANHLILIGAGLIMVSIFAGMISSRFGAPLLLVFLVLGMLAGEDGPGGINFDDFQLTYTVGSVALAIILFDGGLRTRWKDLAGVGTPAVLLATFGVLVTAAITGTAAHFFLGVGWIEGMLVGSIVASTDAAAVFLLLHLRGMRLRERLRAVLEAEAGLNDPMAVLLTVTCVGLLTLPDFAMTTNELVMLSGRFTLQIIGGILLGIAGGYSLLQLINRVSVASGLYPLIAVSGALLLFAVAQELGASGFLAAYFAGLIVGNQRHKATLLINRFFDGLGWLSQISMFLILGLLVTPSSLGAVLLPALGIAAVLTFIARPIAVSLSLPWFRFNARETAFVSWVGLRGAVPIFLGTIPVLAGIDGAETYFAIVYVIVLASLMVQGWTVGVFGRRVGVLLPPRPSEPPRLAIDLPSSLGRDMAAYTVQPRSLAMRRPLKRLPLPDGVDLVSVLRDGRIHTPDTIPFLSAGDDVLLLTASDAFAFLDRLFGEPISKPGPGDDYVMGAFPFGGDVAIGAIADTYGFDVPIGQLNDTVATFLARHLFGKPAIGRRIRLGEIELIVGDMTEGKISRVNIDLEPPVFSMRRIDPVMVWARTVLWMPLARRATAVHGKVRSWRVLPSRWKGRRNRD